MISVCAAVVCIAITQRSIPCLSKVRIGYILSCDAGVCARSDESAARARIEVFDPNLPEGEEVDVLVLSASARPTERIKLYDWFRQRAPQPKPRGAEALKG